MTIVRVFDILAAWEVVRFNDLEKRKKLVISFQTCCQSPTFNSSMNICVMRS